MLSGQKLRSEDPFAVVVNGHGVEGMADIAQLVAVSRICVVYIREVLLDIGFVGDAAQPVGCAECFHCVPQTEKFHGHDPALRPENYGFASFTRIMGSMISVRWDVVQRSFKNIQVTQVDESASGGSTSHDQYRDERRTLT